MPTTADLLEALADCLSQARPIPDALALLERAGGAAARFARPLAHQTRSGVSFGSAVAQLRLLRPVEVRLLRGVDRSAALAPALRAIAARRRQRAARVRALLGGVAGPLGLIVLTILVDPLFALFMGGDYLGPVLRSLLVLGAACLVAGVGLPLLFGSGTTGPAAQHVAGRLPLLGGLVRRHAESELATGLAAFALPDRLPPESVQAAALLVSWPPLERSLGLAARRAAAGSSVPEAAESARAAEPARAADPGRAADAVRSALPEGIALVLVAGTAAGVLPDRLRARAEEDAAWVTRRLRTVARGALYVAMVVMTLQSLSGLLSGGLPGLPGLDGKLQMNGPEAKELEQLMRELDLQ